ncbi:MAG: 16S rRNA (cytosine(1402)-N(4))-methyltransferase RsmH [Gammaproteobacteria bacterium]
MTADIHRPVMLAEVLEALAVTACGRYLDATFGRGGHAAAILERLGPEGRLLAMDKDPQAVQAARARFGSDPRFAMVHDSFAALESVVAGRGWSGRLNGVLLDLGVSSPQLDDPRRGFSFRNDGPLDMRMNPAVGESAAQWLAHASEGEIARVLRDYGEERYARRIARAIVRARQESPIVTTARLAALVAAANPAWEQGKDPATRTFQALRIHINRELEELQSGLEQAVRVLAPGGRLVVISFHSLEDRIVKRFIRRAAQGEALPRRLPVTEAARGVTLRTVGKPRRPAAAEVAVNLRARSAVLRVAERLP